MAKSDRTVLSVKKRSERGTRASRRLRRTGFVPGVFYGSDSESLAIMLDEKELQKALASGSQLFDVTVESGKAEPAVIKEHQRDPIDGSSLHLDLMKVRMDEEIQASVPIVLEGGEEAPGVIEGGIIEHVTREINVEALPSDMPEQIIVDVSGMEAAETFLLEQVPEQPSYKILDDPELVASIDQLTEERALLVHGVKAFGLLAGQLDPLHRDEVESRLFIHLYDFADELVSEPVGLH